MVYFFTGATGFIGKRLVRKVLARKGSVVYFLVRDDAPEKLAPLYEYWGVGRERAIPVKGDIGLPGLGIKLADQRRIAGKVDHVFHLAAIYDLKADEASQIRINVQGTRNLVQFAQQIKAGCVHHMSSIAAAGLYDGLFREDMFTQARKLDHPYFSTKHASEMIVRKECKVPRRIYRPGLVVGDSRTGEMDKIDGPYYFFKLIQKLRHALPQWMPTIGVEGGRINIVPVDFVVDAVDHIAHQPGLDGKCFHIVDPEPMRVGDVLQTFAKAAHAPTMSIRINAGLLGFIPGPVMKGLLSITPVKRLRDVMMKELELPDDVLQFINYPTRFDCRQTLAALKGSGIECPRLETYAWVVWDYWERHLDPELFIDRTLKGAVGGKVVLITGGSSGIGLAAAHKMAEAGAITVICGRDEAKLAEAAAEVRKATGRDLVTFAVDLADLQDCDRMCQWIIEAHGGVDVLINNAGRSIRRSIESSFDSFHDVERTLQLNYLGAVRITMGLMPAMMARKAGHIVNISSIGVLTNAPRFSAYVASKAALDAWTRCAASEFADMGITFTTINMPLVRTPMIAPTKLYNNVPTLSPEEAADLIAQAVVYKPVRIATRLGIAGQALHALFPKAMQVVMNTAFRMFHDSGAAQGRKGKRDGALPLNADQIAMQQLMRGIHF